MKEIVYAAAIGGLCFLLADRPARSNPPVQLNPVPVVPTVPGAVVPAYGNSPTYQTTQTGLISAADFKKLLDHQAAIEKGQAEQTAVLRAIAAKVGADTGPAAAAAQIDPGAVLRKYCAACHTGPGAKKGVRLFDAPDGPPRYLGVKGANKVADVIAEGSMPPEGSPQPSKPEKAALGG